MKTRQSNFALTRKTFLTMWAAAMTCAIVICIFTACGSGENELPGQGNTETESQAGKTGGGETSSQMPSDEIGGGSGSDSQVPSDENGHTSLPADMDADKTDGTGSGDTDPDVDNVLLEEFTALLCSFNEYIGGEKEKYFKDEFVKWLSEEAYQYIKRDADGHLTIPDHDARYIGTWYVPGMTGNTEPMEMRIEPAKDKYYSISVTDRYPNYTENWSLRGTYDDTAGGIKCNGYKYSSNRYFSQDDEDEESGPPPEAEGFIWLGDDGTLYWDDYYYWYSDEGTLIDIVTTTYELLKSAVSMY